MSTKPPKPVYHLEAAPDKAGKWRWNAVSLANGQVVFTSHESFATASNARRAARKVASHGKPGAFFVAGGV